MKYLRFFRWPNLLVIIFTMLFVRNFIIGSVLRELGPEALLPYHTFLLLVVSFVLIAAGGYVINDLSDTDVDSRNKPDKMLIGSAISFKMANYLYLLMNGVAFALAIWLSYDLQSWRFGLIMVMMIGLLWFYSKRYKRMLLVGNVVVAVASSMALLIVWLAQFFYLATKTSLFVEASLKFPLILEPLLAFTFFSFLTSLAREIVKDIEDVEGDSRYGCRSLPVVAGISVARWAAQAILLLIVFLLVGWQYHLIKEGRIVFAASLILALIVTGIAVFQLARANQKQQYHLASTWIKLAMVSGVASMLFWPF